jgi:hypothetical protein
MKKEARIPTILGLLLLIVSLFGGVYLSSRNQNLSSKANSDCKPQNPQVTNITHNSAEISYFTQTECASVLKIDKRTITNHFASTSPKSKTHYFIINGLKEKNNYIYSVISEGNTYTNQSYSFTTASKPIGNIPTSNLAWGRVFNSDQTPASNAIVYLNIPGASPLSSPVTENGYWNISLAISFNADKNNWFSLSTDTQEDIVVISSDGQTTQITSHSSRNNPVPDIIIGQNSFSDTKPVSQQTTGQLDQYDLSPATKNLEIFNPTENETLSTQKPEFFGSAPSSAKVIIKVESPQTINSETTSSSDGTWKWSPPSNLSPGQHTITVSTQDPATGVWQTITRQFVVLAADTDSSLAFSSSSSATPVVSTPTSVPVVTKTLTPTLIPTKAPIATLAPTLKPSPIPTVVTEMPVAGNSSPTILFLLFSFPLIALSLHLFTKSGKFN